MQVDGSEECSDLLRALEQQTFHAAFGDRVPHTPEFMLHEYGPYDENSTFFGAIDSTSGQVLGALRIISQAPGKTLEDLSTAGVINLREIDQEYQFSESKFWDIGSVAVTTTLRGTIQGQRISTLLYHALYSAAVEQHVVQWTSVIDSQVLQRYLRLGIPFERLGGLEDLDYLGSAATACHLWVQDIRPSMEAAGSKQQGRLRQTINTILNGCTESPKADVKDLDLRDQKHTNLTAL